MVKQTTAKYQLSDAQDSVILSNPLGSVAPVPPDMRK
jgi:hypothetical protein